MQQQFYTILFLIGYATLGFSQHTVTGTVIAKSNNDILIGVTVQEKGETTGVFTDIEGKFTITVKRADAILIFSYVGHQPLEVAIEGQTNLTVQLIEASEQFKEVVVTALGIKRQKRALGYSAESVEGKTLALSNAPNVINALSGQAAGVQIVSPNGVDGGTSRIVIRGNNNINANNQPLIVVDGVPLENAPGLEDIGRGVDWGSAINNINPEDIENMNILKGPTAAALYGARGANGVILITTKRGSPQKGIGIQYAVNHKIIQPYRYREVQNVYGSGGPAGQTLLPRHAAFRQHVRG